MNVIDEYNNKLREQKKYKIEIVSERRILR